MKVIIEPKLIEDISDELVEEMRLHLVPIFKSSRNALSEPPVSTFVDMSKIHPKDVAYTWVEDVDKVEIGRLFLFDAVPIITYHRWGYHGFFKPSLYEVFCAIYRALGDEWKKVKYFWLDTASIGLGNLIGDYRRLK